jgi:ketosteroid isomerase-like protein
MSQENVEIVWKVFEAHTTRGMEAALPLFAPDVVWDPGPDWVEDETYRGRDGVRKLNNLWAENFEDYALEPHEIRDLGDRVLALYEMTGRIRDSDQTVHRPLGIVVSDFREGMVGAIRSFPSWHEALQAVGLER